MRIAAFVVVASHQDQGVADSGCVGLPRPQGVERPLSERASLDNERFGHPASERR